MRPWLLLALCGCARSSAAGDAPPPPASAAIAPTTTVAPPPAPSAEAREACEPPVLKPAPWRHRSTATKVASEPAHSAVDVIVNPGSDALVAGKFAYGRRSRDLEDEDVVLYLRDPVGCSWSEAGREASDDDGRVSFTVPASSLSGPRHELRMVVLGDGSSAEASIWVLAKNTPVVVFDVDGTLTTGDEELAGEVLAARSATVRPGAAEVVRKNVAAGLQPVYFTGRPYLFTGLTRRWLAREGMAPGPLRTTDHMREAIPSPAGVEAFKQRELERLRDSLGLVLTRAYGNATTDVCAYAKAGIDPAVTFIIGPHAGTACAGFAATVALSDYPSHAASMP